MNHPIFSPNVAWNMCTGTDDAAAAVVIVNKKSRKRQQELADAGYMLIDVTSTSSDETFRKFSPFYAHGSIPVPGMEGRTSQSVEGVWQGLKVFENEGIDATKFDIKNAKNIKRSSRAQKRGPCVGHRFGEEKLEYIEARKRIFVPTYQFVLEQKLAKELALLKGLVAEGNRLALLDYETNEDVDDPRKPLSHASLVKRCIM